MTKSKIQLTQLKEKYEEVMDERNILKADGSLSKLANLRGEFDETFDYFFDSKQLRKKYDAWNDEEDCINFDITNTDLEEMLKEEDLQNLVEFYKNYIGSLEDEINELKSNSRFNN
jgi:hypothetical protein